MSILSGASLISGTRNKRRLIGVTGPMAAGKNVAADILRAQGFTVLDADKIAHDVLDEQKDRICKLFAHDAQKTLIPLVDGEGNILRKNLARIVFRDPQKLALLENLIHPAVNDIIEKRITASPSESFVVNAALLYNITHEAINEARHTLCARRLATEER
ncbi:MAG: dephospho-CoA kinase [Treponema maltophilum]